MKIIKDGRLVDEGVSTFSSWLESIAVGAMGSVSTTVISMRSSRTVSFQNRRGELESR